MKKLNNLTIIAIAAILTACGGGGGGGGEGNSDNSSGVEQPKPPVTPPSTNYPSVIQPSDYEKGDEKTIYSTINNNRTTCGFSSLKQSKILDTAAKGHANYLTLNTTSGHTQNPTMSGFTGSDLAQRIKGAGYSYISAGEILAVRNTGSMFAGTSSAGIETSADAPTAQALINTLFSSVYHLGSAVGDWSDIGIGYGVTGNISNLTNLTMYYGSAVVNFGVSSGSDIPTYSGTDVRTFPCNGIEGVSPIFLTEMPSPYPERDFSNKPMGTPILLAAPNGKIINVLTGSIIETGTTDKIDVKILNSSDDVNKLVRADQSYVIPNIPLKSNTSYEVKADGKIGNDNFSTAFRFKTGSQN